MQSAPEELFSVPENDGAVMASWEHFLVGRPVPAVSLRHMIGQSWKRCLGAEVDYRRWQAPPPIGRDELAAAQHSCQDLIDASTPVMASARHFLHETGTVMVLADPAGMVLNLEGDISLRSATENIHLVPGANWSEVICGTNAIGTTLQTGRPVQIHSNEHFCEGIKQWSCSAAVIRDPYDGAILGAVDISGLRQSYSRHSMALVVATAARIENRLAQLELDIRYRLLERCLDRLSPSNRAAVVILDRQGRPIKANTDVSLILRDLGMPAADGQGGLAALTLEWQRDAVRPDRLPGWLRPDWLTPIYHGSDRLGAVLEIPGRHAVLAKPRRGVSGTPGPDERGTDAAFGNIVGQDPALRQAVERASRVAASAAPVLLLGETGVGKEVFSRSIHDASKRSGGRFVALNCGGLSRDLLTSELFGYAEGSFTGARKGGMAGKIEAADGGTLFLDEIGEMPLDLQPLFLRVLEEREVCRIGEVNARKVDFRLIAATNRDLRREVEAGRFRMDLFYRVSVVSITIPALRDRRSDIPDLANHFVGQLARRHDLPSPGFSLETLDYLQRYAWPGNIRELRNVVESMLLTANGREFTPADLPTDLISTIAEDPLPKTDRAALTPMERAERDAILTMVQSCRGNLTLVARQLGIAKSTLYVKLRKFSLEQTVGNSRGE